MKFEAIPLYVVTGFLGAGKTTLINRLLKTPALADALIVVNEFGEIGIDNWLYEALPGDVRLMPSGCLCCDLRGDLVEALGDLLRRRDAGDISPFRRLVLETSGLADPSPILHALFADPLLSLGYELAGVIPVVDALNGSATLEAHGEAARQAALADVLVLTKSDLVGPETLAVLRAELARRNPDAEIVDTAEADLADILTRIGPSRGRAGASAMSAHGGGARAFAFSSDAAVEAESLQQFFFGLRRLLGPKLLRLKGLVVTRDDPSRPLLVQAAQHAFHPPRRLPAWPDGRAVTRIVVIAEDMDPKALEALWRALSGEPQIDRPDLAALTQNPLAPRPGGFFD